ncbi:hypothetical protein [Methanosarcina sp.]|uniref:hypothetical protein n=1 Tax=Methanosarcina sp. TaxID=2213 RepID=UPI003BB7E918
MVESGIGKIVNGVGSGPASELLQIGANATAAKMLPGIAVVRDANDFSVKEYTSGNAEVGVLGWEKTPITWRPATIDTAYNVGDFVSVESGPGYCRMRLAASQTIVMGDPLKLTTDGYLVKATLNGSETEELTGNAQSIVVGNDDVYAKAKESVTTTTGTGTIWVKRLR